MMRTPPSWILVPIVLSSAAAFFMDTRDPIIFRNNDGSFGHQVVQLDRRVIVSAPLQASAINRTGQLYDCNPQSRTCTAMPVTAGSDDGINMSLGLTLAVQEKSPQLLTCGPTLQRVCGVNMYINGQCYQLNRGSNPQRALPAFLPECSLFKLDIVFLIDGSGSVSRPDFQRMLTFVSTIMTSFSTTDTQFALMQYSSNFQTHFDFNRFSAVRDPTVLTSDIKQMQELTRTATGIYKVITELFVRSSGARDEAVKLLIVITDGQIYGDDRNLKDTANEAKRRGIVSFAIGVGSAFRSPAALEELQTIASSSDQIFRVTDFSALSQFQKTLQEKIFAIEGTQSKDATSFQLEMSQEGFSAILTEEGPILGAVGAYDWSGGISLYSDGQQNGTWINATKDQTDMVDSYMGYAMQKVTNDIIAIGAPRYQHTGKVLIYKRNPRNGQWRHMANVNGEQIGSYFGSVLTVLYENTKQPVLVVGSPTYYSPEVPSGRVYLCPIPTQVKSTQITTISCPETLQGDTNQTVSQFGSTLAVLPDLTGDQLPDLAVGAPYEDNYQGAIYIFPGQEKSFRTSYIQRVTGNQVSSGIKFFGRSLSGNMDMTRDGIPDVTIGGEGQVLILKSRPVIGVSVSMTFNPPKIALTSYECSLPRRQEAATTATLCFRRELKSTQATGGISVQVNYTLLLDSALTQFRAVFSRQTPNTRTVSRSIQLTDNCVQHPIFLPECVEDSLTPLRLSLSFSLMGDPVLSEDTRPSHVAEVPFEKNCGGDELCEDDLRLAINFTGVSQLVVGTLLDINVTVSVKSVKDDSYNTRVLIPFPVGLSYRRVTLVESNRKVTVLCATLEGQSVVNCAVNRPLLRPNTTVVFMVGFHVSSTATLGNSLLMVANVTSDNTESANNRRTSSATVDVLYAILVTITSLEESSKYQNFTSNNSTIEHVYRVNNQGQRSLSLSIIFLLPVKLGEATVWEKINISSSEPEITNCTTKGQTQGDQNFKDLINTTPIFNCSVGLCVRMECQISELEAQSSVIFRVNGSVTKNWTTQTEQKKITLQSRAEIVYDSRTFHQSQHFTSAQAQTVLEVPIEYNYFPVIIGSSVGGLVLLALITAALYKLGFFKRQYKDMLDNSAGGEMVDGEAPPGPQNVGETN